MAAETPSFWRSRRAVAIWLFAVAAIILGMIVVGGLTRLTGSGLSITQWDPIMGAIPPLNDAKWQDAFAKYRQIPQYIEQNSGMSLAAFKGIFWWEWTHRLLGRLLGVLFFVPFVWFAWTGGIKRSEWPRMIGLFLLGGLQGLVGWWMVMSGLETRVSVAPYRLATHLGVALILLIAMVWTALEYLRLPRKPEHSLTWPRLPVVLTAMVYVQMLLGALVAGLHAGLIYNTWPSMNGRVFPEDAFFASPWWINVFENPGLAQFDHRMGAYLVAIVAIVVGLAARRANGLARRSGTALMHLTLLQIVLGITTLLMQAPEYLAAAHQFLAALILCTAVWHVFERRYTAIA
ncbi:MAG: COX15/CtaA family protein [Proteobacteria bacterium]|nr:COX15/CtaA family protein [Pseudomonadota bacterium]